MTNPNDKELATFRAQIDEIDDKIIDLLLERTGIVANVGALKRKTAAGICPIRSGREAEMLRRVLNKFEGTLFPPAAAAGIWRVIIGASTALEADLTMSVFAPDRENDLFWLAREYFGMTTPVIKQPHIKRVIGDVMDGTAAVGIIPALRGDDTTYWWTNLMQQGPDVPKIFAHIPFVYPAEPDKHAVGALAIARLTPEPSGNDMTILVIEVDHNVSQHRLQSAFSSSNIDATSLNIATLSSATRHHLVRAKGFFPKESDEMKAVLAPLGRSVFNVTFLGAYAVPVTLTQDKKSEHSSPSHAAKSSQS